MDMADFIPLVAKLTGVGGKKKSTASHTTAQNTKLNCPPFSQKRSLLFLLHLKQHLVKLYNANS